MLMGTPNQVLGTTVASEWVRGHRSTCMGYRGENDILVHNAHSGAYSPRGRHEGMGWKAWQPAKRSSRQSKPNNILELQDGMHGPTAMHASTHQVNIGWGVEKNKKSRLVSCTLICVGALGLCLGDRCCLRSKLCRVLCSEDCKHRGA